MGSQVDPTIIIDNAIEEHVSVIQTVRTLRPVLERVAKEMTRAVLDNKKVLWFGNGGSAADSQHMAAEFVGRFRRERRGLPSIALTTDTSALTAIGNDYGFDVVFSRQVEALCNPGDIVVGISTSGNSKNVCLALEAARAIGAFTVAMSAGGGGKIGEIAHVSLNIGSKNTARIQEAHILCGHILCDWIDLSINI